MKGFNEERSGISRSRYNNRKSDIEVMRNVAIQL